MSLRKVPQSALIDNNGNVTKEWRLFFTLIAKDIAGWQPPEYANADAPDNTIFYSTTNSKLVYKTSAGVVNNLY
jgi:hypothetical protein